MIALTGVVIYFFVQYFIVRLRQSQKEKFLDNDLNNVTAGDYTVEFTINEEFYD